MKLLVANHKMNMSYEEEKNYLEQLNQMNFDNCSVVIIPSFLYITLFSNSKFKVGAQNVSTNDNGALTGEVSAKQLKSVLTSYCLVGHSERRTIIKENNNDFINKLKQLLDNDIIPIFCIGESLSEKNIGLTNNILENEIRPVFDVFGKENIERIVIAYEPIWAIGTGIVPTNEEIASAVTSIKNIVKSNYDIDIKVLYGGSVNPNNIDNLEMVSSIDGYLVGGASLDAKKMYNISGGIKYE